VSRRAPWFPAALVAALALTLLFLTLPIVAIFVDTSPVALLESLGEEGALDALRLSLVCTLAAVAIIVAVGTPAAWLLASCRWCCRPRWRGSGCWPRWGRTGCSAGSSRTRACGSCSRRPA
jgi:ABC-type sulfate transport system permease component